MEKKTASANKFELGDENQALINWYKEKIKGSNESAVMSAD
jgi:hypothetical protein